MRSRRLILSLILLTLLATCLAAAAKLRATPKYDRIQVGMTADETALILGPLRDAERVFETTPNTGEAVLIRIFWRIDEGIVRVDFIQDEGDRVSRKHITRRGPLERLAWLAGWR